MSLVRIGSKNQVVIPKSVRTQLGVGPGDYVEIDFDRNRALIKPKKIVDRDELLGPKTRAAIQQALKEVKKGRTYGPFHTYEELIEDLHKRAGVKNKSKA